MIVLLGEGKRELKKKKKKTEGGREEDGVEVQRGERTGSRSNEERGRGRGGTRAQGKSESGGGPHFVSPVVESDAQFSLLFLFFRHLFAVHFLSPFAHNSRGDLYRRSSRPSHPKELKTSAPGAA